MPQNCLGISPLSAGRREFIVRPDPVSFDHASILVPTVRETVGAAFQAGGGDSYLQRVDVVPISDKDVILDGLI